MSGRQIDPYAGTFDELVSASAALRSGPLFSALAPVVVSVQYIGLVRGALWHAKSAGLWFGHQPTIRFVSAPGRARGQTEWQSPTAIVSINTAECLTQVAVAEVLLHELQHAADMATGAFQSLSVGERERRAIDFSVRTLKHWQRFGEWSAA